MATSSCVASDILATVSLLQFMASFMGLFMGSFMDGIVHGKWDFGLLKGYYHLSLGADAGYMDGSCIGPKAIAGVYVFFQIAFLLFFSVFVA